MYSPCSYPTAGWKDKGKKGATFASSSQEPQESQPNPDDPFVQMQTMFTTWSTGFDERYTNDMTAIRGDLTHLNTRVDDIYTQVGQMREFQNTLQANWYNIHGSWNTLQPFDANEFFSTEGGEGYDGHGGDGMQGDGDEGGNMGE